MQIGDRMTAIPTELSCDVDNRTKEPIPMVGEEKPYEYVGED